MANLTETLEFQAETRQLLDLMIHSLYTNKEIFLRELISNASDALDRLRFAALTDAALLEEGEELEIRLDADKQARTLTIQDNGIGMSREEVVANIGSIAKSGTRETLDKIKAAQGGEVPPELIGRFGVGFYSAFMAADKITLETRRAGEATATRWESEADGTYTLAEGSRSKRGTAVTLHLKAADSEAGIEDFTDEWTLSRTVKRYSDFIAYPIRQKVQREEKETDEKGILKPDGKTTVVTEDKTLNSMKPIWARAAGDVTEEEHTEFYRHLSGDWNEPLLHLRVKAEGISEYESLLYIPSEPQHDLHVWGMEFGLRIYARRVLIMERCEEAVPRYLRFVYGVVDSSDLPLNISRQTLQENRHIAQINKFLARKALDALADLQKNDEEKYLKFWKHFGSVLKEGVGTAFEHKERLTALMLFASSHHPEKLTTLKEYVERLQEGQPAIFYLTGESRSMVENSPLLEAFRKKNYEVLYLTDPVDELLVQYLTEFDGKKLQSAAKGELDLGDEKEKKQLEEERKEQEKKYSSLLDLLGKKLESGIKKVRLSTRLTDSPACLAGDEHDVSPQLERMMRMANPDGPKQKRILELNGAHEIVRKLHERFDKDKTDPVIDEYAELLYGYALLSEGVELPDAVKFNRALAGLMAESL